MSNKPVPVNPVLDLLKQSSIRSRFQEILKDKAAGFTANLAVMVNNSETLQKCDPSTIISAAVISASLDLPLDPNLGFAAIVPYNNKAQYQIMYKGLIQLAMRSGQYKTINVTEVYEGEIASENRITGEYKFDFQARTGDKIIGYAAYFRLLNGFEKMIYWPRHQVEKHAGRFSQTYKKGYGLWKDDFHSMAKKTVLKMLLSKWGILSIEMQHAVRFDQKTVRNPDDIQIHILEAEDHQSLSQPQPLSEPQPEAPIPQQGRTRPAANKYGQTQII